MVLRINPKLEDAVHSLRRAFADLGEGLRCLSELDGDTPQLVDELLASEREARHRAAASVHRPAPERRARRSAERARRARLVVVK